jgi:4-amino-4-deoxy-L-arabinose transferase-like glycosyltransferase
MRVVRRNTELGLIVLALLIITGAYVLAALGRTASMPTNLVPFLVFIVGLLVAAHVALRRLAPDADPVLLPIAGLLNGIGYVFIARLDPDLAGLQATWTALGVGAFVLTLIVVKRARDLERLRYTVALVGVAPADDAAAAGRRAQHQRCPPLGAVRPGELPARRVRQDRPGDLLRQLPRREA